MLSRWRQNTNRGISLRKFGKNSLVEMGQLLLGRALTHRCATGTATRVFG